MQVLIQSLIWKQSPVARMGRGLPTGAKESLAMARGSPKLHSPVSEVWA